MKENNEEEKEETIDFINRTKLIRCRNHQSR